jgi:hypothetical protein
LPNKEQNARPVDLSAGSMASSALPAFAGINVHQFYSLDMPQACSAALADIFSFEGTRAVGEPTRYTIQFTHPSHGLSRGEYLNRPAAFVIQPPARGPWSSPEPARRVRGVITGFAQGTIAPEPSHEVDERGGTLVGVSSWQWEADRARAALCSAEKPCPREGRWIASSWRPGGVGKDAYAFYPESQRVFSACDTMPTFAGYGGVEVPYLLWHWLGA